MKEKFGVLQKKVLSFGPNRTVEVQPNSSAEPNVRSVTTIYTFIFEFGEIKFFELLRPSKTSVRGQKRSNFKFLTFNYALKIWALGRSFSKHCPVSSAYVRT